MIKLYLLPVERPTCEYLLSENSFSALSVMSVLFLSFSCGRLRLQKINCTVLVSQFDFKAINFYNYEECDNFRQKNGYCVAVRKNDFNFFERFMMYCSRS